MASYYFVNDQQIAEGTAVFGPNFRGLKYGDGFFETMRFANGRLMHLLLHAERIRKSAMLLKMSLPAGWDEIAWETQITSFCAKNNISGARIRVLFLRDSEGYYTPNSNEVCIVTEVQNDGFQSFQWNNQGLQIGTYNEMVKNGNYTSMLKTCSALVYTMAGIYAKEKEWDECIILNDFGRPCEAISSNIFVVANDFIITPPLSEYCVDGIMRKVVIQLIEAYGYTLQERPITEVELNAADEIFLTNSVQGIQWVSHLHGKPMKNSVSKVLFDQLNRIQ